MFGFNTKKKKRRRKKRKPLDTSKRVVWISVIAIVSYTVASLILQFCTQTEVSSTLTNCFFGFFAIELFNLSRITIVKNKNPHFSNSGVVAEETKDYEEYEEE